ncbi:GrpB family protein [Paenibacillus sp. SYP-B3998]|uniref:GrpB family protein n=1 Tax=Paenibacillus sp. SYP-B3998 TaxID=2678564 RepID=A0A6G3ZRX2_9BACL|nr:GrpB family protein [Paenibacillus sp. SYP-B3998]NEW04882.1 GrpB family protein [Paenibacillus sp. SYP-B3998]
MDKPVIIEEHNEDWALEYKQEERKIQELLGHKAISIEHIGSTSVKGLGAKPIIDFMVGVNDLKEVDELIESLKKIGYDYVFHKEFPNRRFFRIGQWRAGTHHLHMYEFGSEEWTNNILFRDYLRNHPDVLKQYNQLKKDLAGIYRNDRTAYTNAKHFFITDIIEKAKKDANT